MNQSEEWRATLTFIFPIREEAWLHTVPQVSEIPVPDVVLKGETF